MALQQWTLSGLIDAGTLKQLTDPDLAPLGSRAHMSLLGLEGAGTWLHTIPSDALGTRVEPSLFITMLQRRLRMPIFGEPFFCPFCDGVMDVLADHALTCACGGDRTKRHNLLRDACVRLTWAAGWRPEPEKEGLLQATSFPASQEGDGLRSEARRPADIFLPRWDLGGSAALDFAVTSGLRTSQLEQTVADGLSSLTSYESIKDEYKGTAAHCAREGITFVPMLTEAHSGA